MRGNGASVPPVSGSNNGARPGLSCAPISDFIPLAQDALPACHESLPSGERGNGASIPPVLALGPTEALHGLDKLPRMPDGAGNKRHVTRDAAKFRPVATLQQLIVGSGSHQPTSWATH